MKINGSEIGGSYYHDVLTLTCEGKQLKATTLEIWEWLAQKAAQQKRAADGAEVCRVVNHVYIDGVCAQCGSPEPPRRKRNPLEG